LPCAELDKLRVFTGWRGADSAAVLPRVAAIINEMAQTAAKAKIHLLVENEGACNVATCAELAALMKLAPSKWIGINWDRSRFGRETLTGENRMQASRDSMNEILKMAAT
jgi:sugar phosphate isomerase/epimerase